MLSEVRGKYAIQEEALDIRLKSVLREKELLFSRMMDIEKVIEQLKQ